MNFSDDHIDTWRRDGALVIPGFFSDDEVAPVVADFEALYCDRAGADEALVRGAPQETGRFHPAQFKGVQPVPLPCSPALNLIGTHPRLVAFAKQALRT